MDDAGPSEFYFVPDPPVPTLSGSQYEGPGVEQDLLGDSSWVTVLPASMTRTRMSFVLLNAEAFLADIISGRHLCLGLLNVLMVPRGATE